MVILTLSLIIQALLAASVASVVTAIVGCFTVLRGLSSMGAAVAHTALAGAVAGYLIGAPPYVGGAIAAVLFSLIVAGIGLREKGRMETIIGMSFGFTTAIAVLLIAMTSEYMVVAWRFLVGDVLGVSMEEISVLALATAVTVSAIALAYKEFKFITFDFEVAEAMGLNVKLYHTLMLALIALASAVCLRVVGSILTIVFLVAPAAAAYQITHTLERMMIFSVAFSITSAVTGVLLAVPLNLPPSALGGVIASLLYFISAAYSYKAKVCEKCARQFRVAKEGVPR